MENSKRIYRELDTETKQKISKANTGKRKSESHKQHLSQSMKRYWQGVPNKPKQTTMDDLIGRSPS